jgi:solute carrier family 41
VETRFCHFVRQSALSFQVASVLVHWLWSKGIDPDNAAIPYLTSLGDLLGGALLAGAFHLYYSQFLFANEEGSSITTQSLNASLNLTQF